MMKKNNLKNNDGIAIVMVLSAVALLTLIMANFTFDTKVNKIKLYNQRNKEQARLNAEAGMLMALAKLKIYKEARNVMEKNKNLKDIISEDKVLALITQPFIYPIPIPVDANIIQKTAFEEFTDSVLIQGSMMVSIITVSGFLNPNSLRVSKKLKIDKNNSKSSDISPQLYIEQQLIETLKSAIESKKETDKEFELKYADLDPELLIKELKYFVNPKDNFDDPEKGEIESKYFDAGISAKFAPLTSISELHLLAGWNDNAIELIEDQLTAHEISFIGLNDITDKDLKILFPQIDEENVKRFFEHRDGVVAKTEGEEDQEAQPFKNVSEFKSLIVNDLQVLREDEYDKRIKEFENAGLRLGIAGKLFKIISQGEYNESKFSLEAYIDLPVKPIPEPTPTPTPAPNDDPNVDIDQNPPKDTNSSKKMEKEPPIELLEPRVIEIKAG